MIRILTVRLTLNRPILVSCWFKKIRYSLLNRINKIPCNRNNSDRCVFGVTRAATRFKSCQTRDRTIKFLAHGMRWAMCKFAKYNICVQQPHLIRLQNEFWIDKYTFNNWTRRGRMRDDTHYEITFIAYTRFFFLSNLSLRCIIKASPRGHYVPLIPRPSFHLLSGGSADPINDRPV